MEEFVLNECNNLNIQADPYSPVDDLHLAECVFDENGESTDAKQKIVIPTVGQKTKAQNRNNINNVTFESVGPTDHLNSVQANFTSNYIIKSCTVLLHRKFSGKSPIHTVHLLPEFHIIPEYLGVDPSIPEEEKKEIILKNIQKQTNLDEKEILKDKQQTLKQLNSTKNVRCMIGAKRKGYLYDVTDPRLLSEYTFTNPTFSLKMTSSIMYTLTQSNELPHINSIVMWTIRGCSSAGELFPSPCILGMEEVNESRALIVVDDYLLVTPHIEFNENEKISSPLSPTKIFRTSSLLKLFDDIRDFAKENEKSSKQGYFQLMLELHYLLESKLQSLNQRLMQTKYYKSIFLSLQKNNNDKNVNILSEAEQIQELDQLQIESSLYHSKYKESSGALGDYQFETKLYARAAVFYAESDYPLTIIVEKLFSVANQENSSSSARRGLINYLDIILFDKFKKHMINEEEKPEFSDKILAIYHHFSRPRLASVILESQLRLFNQDSALRLLEDPRKINTTDHASQISKRQMFTMSLPVGSLSSFQSIGLSLKSIFVRGLLFLDAGQPNDAKNDFLPLESEIIEFCVQNPQLFHLDINLSEEENIKDISKKNLSLLRNYSKSVGNSILPGVKMIPRDSSFVSNHDNFQTLGEFLYLNDPWCLLEILTLLIDFIPIFDALKLLHFHQLNKELNDDMNFLIENYLEWIILNKIENCSEIIYESLIDIYLNHIYNNYNKQANPNDNISKKSIIRKKWLNHHKNTFLNHHEDWLKQIEPFNTNYYYFPSNYDKENSLPDLFYLQKLQGLLSMNHLFSFSSIYKNLLDKIENQKNVFDGKISLELLCFPVIGKLMDAVEIIIQKFPLITCSYCIKYCLSLHQWKEVLFYLSNSISSSQVYCDIISFLVTHQDPVSFVSLLPENGNIHFFGPFIEQCYRFYYANNLNENIIAKAKNRVNAE